MVSISRFLYFPTNLRNLRHSLFSATFSSSTSPSSSSSSNNRSIPECVAYRRSMLRPPSKVASLKVQQNACSFIGTLDSHVKCSGKSGRGLLAFAFMRINSDHRVASSSRFCVCLWMQGRLAEISLQHLKRDDFIYVSGALGSYTKLDASGEPQIFYKVCVEELNYVARLNQLPAAARPVKPVAGELFAPPSDPAHEEQQLDRMHLWQLFFANPGEWWDNRRSKRSPSLPDFKHKDTKECLSLGPDDPPWIRRQLQLHDETAIHSSRFKRNTDRLIGSYLE